MSANIYWRFAPKSSNPLQVSAPSNFVTAMERAFGAAPWHISGADSEKLRGMAAAYGGLDRDNPYEQILSKLFDHEGVSHEVDVWPEY